MNGDIDTLMKFIGEHFVFDESIYPELKGKNDDEKRAFAIKHCALHFSKTAGKIAAVSENADHGKSLDMAEIRENVPKAIINTLKLAELAGMTEQDIVQAIESKYNEQIQ